MFAEVVLPLPVKDYFTYKIPDKYKDQVSVGKRVVVNFGAKKFYTGIIVNITEEAQNDNIQIKEISDVLDASPIVNSLQLRFWEWMLSLIHISEPTRPY